MKKLRIAVLGIRHEAMAACPFLTGAGTTSITRGDDIRTMNLTTVTGVFDRLAEEPDVEAVPLIIVRTLPGGSFDRDFYDAIKEESVALLRAQGPFDGVVAVNHGAGEVDGLGVHGDTDYILAVRAAVGPDVPMAVPFDMHGQVTPELLDAITVLACLRTAPHRDNYETSRSAADQLMRVLRGATPPVKAAVHVPLYLPGEKCMTAYEPARRLFGGLAEYEARAGIWGAHLFVGFGWNDLPWCGMKVVVLADDDAALAEACAAELAAAAWAARAEFGLAMPTASLRQGLRQARDMEGPSFLSDSGDNTTAGGGGDLAFVLHEALNLKMTDVLVTGIYAPEIVAACHAAGLGAELRQIIGAHRSAAGQPREVEMVVRGLGASVDASAYENLRSSDGAWALVMIGGVGVTFHADRVAYTGPGHFLAVGIDPDAWKIIVVKVGYLHPQLEDMGRAHVCLLTRGVADLDFLRLDYNDIPRPAYPMDADMDWTPADGRFAAAQG